jgi:hypothetical protein
VPEGPQNKWLKQVSALTCLSHFFVNFSIVDFEFISGIYPVDECKYGGLKLAHARNKNSLKKLRQIFEYAVTF